MHSTEVQAKPLFSWKALGWALLYFWFFSTLLQAIISVSYTHLTLPTIYSV